MQIQGVQVETGFVKTLCCCWTHKITLPLSQLHQRNTHAQFKGMKCQRNTRHTHTHTHTWKMKMIQALGSH